VRAAVRIPAMFFWLTLLWIALWDELTWATFIGGLAVSAGVVLFVQLDRSSLRSTYFRPLWGVWYVIVLLWKLLESNLRLAWEIVTPGIGTYTSIIAVPMRGGSEAVVTVVANSITLTPGTMTVDVKSLGDLDGDGAQDGVVLYVHGMYTKDLEKVRHDVLQLEALALRAFGSPGDYERTRLDVLEHESMLTTEQLAHVRDRRTAGRRRSDRGGTTHDGSSHDGKESS